MNSWLKDLPNHGDAETQIDAFTYNRVRLSLLRLDSPLVVKVADLFDTEVVIDADTWLCLDVRFDNLPLCAWTDFQTHHRNNLHRPIRCRLITYHTRAYFDYYTILDTINMDLTRRLRANPPPGRSAPLRGQILPFNRAIKH